MANRQPTKAQRKEKADSKKLGKFTGRAIATGIGVGLALRVI